MHATTCDQWVCQGSKEEVSKLASELAADPAAAC